MRPSFRHLIPDQPPPSRRERVRAAAGALIGILAMGLLSRAALGSDGAVPFMIAPMGASAVLLFAVPSSPLAQPWSILGGNLVAALVGVTAAAAVTDPVLASALAICGAIALMMALRCLHPPSGAVALTAVLAGPDVRDLGYAFVLWPVGANSLLLLLTALAFNNLTGRAYPQGPPRGPPHGPPAAPVDHGAREHAPSSRAGLLAADLDAALRDHDRYLEVGRSDLEAILRRVRMRAVGRRPGQATCAGIMSRDAIAVAPGAPLPEALDLLRRRGVKALPVTDEGARVIGIVTQTDILDKTVWDRPGPRLGLARRVRLTLARGRVPHGVVEDIMTSPVRTARPETPISDLALWMSDAGLDHLPVVGADGRLVGVVSQTDLVDGLLADLARRADEAAGDGLTSG